MGSLRWPRRSARIAQYRQSMDSLAVALGYHVDSRLLIISADQLGSTYAATVGGLIAMREGVATTGTVMMPGPWSRHAIDRISKDEDFGVHLTLNAELDCFRWGPLTNAPSLLDGDGGFPRTLADLWDHADADEVRRECRAQLERAALWGLDPTHLSTHLSALQQRPEFFDVLLDIAVEANLPLRLEGPAAHAAAGFPFHDLARQAGVITPDHFRLVRGGAQTHFLSVIDKIGAGVTVVAFEPVIATEEIRAIDPFATARMNDLAMLTDRGLSARIAASGATLIGFTTLRDLQRSGL